MSSRPKNGKSKIGYRKIFNNIKLNRIGAPVSLEILSFLKGKRLLMKTDTKLGAYKRLSKEMEQLKENGYNVRLDDDEPLRLFLSKDDVHYEFLFTENYPFTSPIWREGKGAWFVIPHMNWSPGFTVYIVLSKIQDAVTIYEEAYDEAMYLKQEEDKKKRRLEEKKTAIDKCNKGLEECKKEVKRLRGIIRAMGFDA